MNIYSRSSLSSTVGDLLWYLSRERDSPRASKSCQFITSIPLSTVSGKIVQRRYETDRKWLGATSAPKIGVTDALAPSPKPKTNLQTSSCHHLLAVPAPMAPMIQRHAEMQIAPLRPIFFDWSGSENQQPGSVEISKKIYYTDALYPI